MKKIVSTMILLLLILMPVMSDASSLILLKNGGQVVTPFYWFEGRHVFFYYAGGTAGIERKEIAGIRSSEDRERQDTGNIVVWNPGVKALPPEPPIMKRAQQTDKPKEVPRKWQCSGRQGSEGRFRGVQEEKRSAERRIGWIIGAAAAGGRNGRRRCQKKDERRDDQGHQSEMINSPTR